MVMIKIAAILLFVFGAARAVNTGNWHPFVPNGYSGVLTGAAIVFFTYIGFDSVSTAAEECQQSAARHAHAASSRRWSSARFCMAPWRWCSPASRTGTRSNNDAPVANALKAARHQPAALDGDGRSAAGNDLVAAGVSVRTSAHLVRDVARPAAARTSSAACTRSFKRRTSAPGSRDSWSAIPAGMWDIGTFADLSNIGTLFAFIVVSAGVIVLRRKQPDRKRSLPRAVGSFAAAACRLSAAWC